MLSIQQLQDALAKAEAHRRLERAVRSMYPAGRTIGAMQIGDLMLHEDAEPEAFVAVIGAIRKRQAAIEAELAAMGVSLGAATGA